MSGLTINEDRPDAQELDALRADPSAEDFKSLMGREEFRRLWWARVAEPLFRPDLASDHGLRMARFVTERDVAAREWRQAQAICPELVTQSKVEADERERRERSAGRPTE